MVAPCRSLITLFVVVAGAGANAQADIQPIHSFADVPALASSSSDVKARYGKVIAPGGHEGDGDTKVQPVFTRIDKWTRAIADQAMSQSNPAMAAQAMGNMGGGMMNPAAGQTIGKLQSAMVRLSQEFPQDMTAYGRAQSALRAQYDSALNSIEGTFHKQLDDAGCLDPGPKGDCDGIRRAQDKAVLAAGDAYLSKLATPYGDFKAKMTGIASDAQAQIDAANKVFGANVPFFATTIIRSLVNDAIVALGSLAGAENDAVSLVYDRSVAPTLHKS